VAGNELGRKDLMMESLVRVLSCRQRDTLMVTMLAAIRSTR
jgi:hypothetical protein